MANTPAWNAPGAISSLSAATLLKKPALPSLASSGQTTKTVIPATTAAGGGGGGSWADNSGSKLFSYSNPNSSQPAQPATFSVPSISQPTDPYKLTPIAPTTNGYTTTDPATAAKVASMSASAGGTKPTTPMIKAPAAGPTTPTIAPPAPTPGASSSGSSTDTTSASSTTPPASSTSASDTKTRDQAAADAYKASLAMTPEEKAAQAELDALTASEKLGYTNAENQAIPLEFITGQQQAIEKRGLALAEPLQTKLARLQAERQAGSEQAKFELTRADAAAAAEKEAAKPFSVSAGESYVKYNPDTGKYEPVYTAPAKEQTPSEKYGTGSIGEYQFYVDQEKAAGRTPMSFNEYQNQDANRKAIATLANGMTPQQSSTFLTITNKYQADSIANQASQAANAVAIADQVLANPGSSTNQLKALYSLVHSLDPNSAVREGEISLAEKTQSYLQNFGTDLTRIFQGQTISPDATIKLANATKDLAKVWQDSANRRTQQYQSQAQVAGVGDAFGQYLGGFNLGGGSSSGSSDQLDSILDDILGSPKANGLGTPQNGLMRTDRNNNPTAMTTDVARTAGLKEGVDYIVGDAFPGNSNLHTAKLLGDPVDTTIKAIDNMGFYTQSGQPRWTHTAMPKSQWDALSYDQKKQVVAQMYQHEGGTALKSAFA